MSFYSNFKLSTEFSIKLLTKSNSATSAKTHTFVLVLGAASGAKRGLETDGEAYFEQDGKSLWHLVNAWAKLHYGSCIHFSVSQLNEE